MASTSLLRHSIARHSRSTVAVFLARPCPILPPEICRAFSSTGCTFAKKRQSANPQKISDDRPAASPKRGSPSTDPNEERFNLKDIKQQMGSAVDRLSKEMKLIVNRVGRLTPDYLDSIRVESDGQRQHINAVAQVIVIDSSTLSVVAYEPSYTKSIEQALYASPLSLAPKPQADGSLLIPIPKLTMQTRQILAKESGQLCEQARNGIRLVRQSGQKASKADLDSNLITKDDFKSNNKSLDEVTKTHSKSIDEIESKAKSVLLDK